MFVCMQNYAKATGQITMKLILEKGYVGLWGFNMGFVFTNLNKSFVYMVFVSDAIHIHVLW